MCDRLHQAPVFIARGLLPSFNWFISIPSLDGVNDCLPSAPMHGGKGGAPKGDRNGNYRHGRFTKERIAIRKEETAKLRELEKLGRELGLFTD